MALDTRKGLLKEPFTVSGNGKQVRDLIYADDTVALYFEAVKNANKMAGQAFNIGGGMENSFSILELLDFLEKELDVKLRYKFIPWRSSDQKVFVADMKKFRSFCNWSPKVDKFQGVRKMIEWVSKNG
jgi:CDP-paratose 2-epimerase